MKLNQNIFERYWKHISLLGNVIAYRSSCIIARLLHSLDYVNLRLTTFREVLLSSSNTISLYNMNIDLRKLLIFESLTFLNLENRIFIISKPNTRNAIDLIQMQLQYTA